MKIIIFDTETTGLPVQPNRYSFYPYDDLLKYRSARVVQIAMIVYEKLNEKIIRKNKKIENLNNTESKDVDELDKLCNNNGFKKVDEYNFIIKPDGFVILNQKFHNISQKFAEENGISFKNAIDSFAHHFIDANLLIAHNINFDVSVMASEMFRYNMADELSNFLKLNKYCTSLNTKHMTRLKYSNTVFKQPKLIELYEYLFGSIPEGMHDALQDTRILSMCVFKLIEKKLISI